MEKTKPINKRSSVRFPDFQPKKTIIFVDDHVQTENLNHSSQILSKQQSLNTSKVKNSLQPSG